MSTNELLERVRTTPRLPAPRDRRRIREAAHISQRDVAAALGVSVMAINRWERGLTRPRRTHAAAYLSLLEQLEDATAAGA
jgi:transcriptional regulator with XRE-family HTH domain